MEVVPFLFVNSCRYASGAAEELPLMLKTEVADEILDRAERFLPGD